MSIFLSLGQDAELNIGRKDFDNISGRDPFTGEFFHIPHLEPFISIKPKDPAYNEVILRLTENQAKQVRQGVQSIWKPTKKAEGSIMDREELEMRVEIYIFGRLKGQADFRTIERNRKGRAERILEVLRDHPQEGKCNIRMRLNLDKIYEDYQQHGDIKKTLQQVEKKIKKET